MRANKQYEMYVDHLYEIIKLGSRGMDAIYGDYILMLVGRMGLRALLKEGLLETCGVIENAQLYALCERIKT